MAYFKSPRLYIAAPHDEVWLGEQAQAHVAALAGQLPDAAALREFSQRHGVELATMMLYQAILAAQPHAGFWRRLQALPATAQQPAGQPTLAVVPAMLHAEHPEVGGDGALPISIARRCGWQALVVPNQSRGSASTNARLLADWLRDEAPDNTWLLTMSQGGVALRWALERHGADWSPHKVRGWLNVCSTVNGTSLARQMLGSARQRTITRLLLALTGMDADAIRELHPDHFSQAVQTPPHWQVINVVGLTLPAHLQKTSLISRYQLLTAYGPNDGMVCFHESLAPGLIVPVWATDHFFRNPAVAALLYRLLALLGRTGLEGASWKP